jgi:hypothetical protein
MLTPYEFGVKTAHTELDRVLATGLIAGAGGLGGVQIGDYLHGKAQQAGYSPIVQTMVGKFPIAASGALSAGLYNYLQDQYAASRANQKLEKDRAKEHAKPKSYWKYLLY